MKLTKTLHRSATNRVLAGVLAGLAEYFGHDPLAWRIGFIILLILTGLFPGIFVYVLMWLLVTEAPSIEPLDSTDYTVYH